MKENLFFGSTEDVAKKLLGKFLIHKTKEGIAVGKIVETEAYLHNDPASHSYGGITPRNKPMFDEAGTSYVYFIYGMYFCFNVVTNDKGVGEAVLIRAIEPIDGIELMKKRRNVKVKLSKNNLHTLCNGPGKLATAFGITKAQNHIKILDRFDFDIMGLFIVDNFDNSSSQIQNSVNLFPQRIISTTRIGLTKAKSKKLRYLIRGNPFVSR